VFLVCFTSGSSGQSSTGYQSCAGSECHAKTGEIDWLTSKPGGQEHRASLGKLRQARDNSQKYAQAVGLTSFEDPKGMCVKCHATYVDKAKLFEGVGCEGCHGPASAYREFHSQTPKDYRGAVSRGMRDILRKPATWVRGCRDCHVLTGRDEYNTLLDAGHKDGARWTAAAVSPTAKQPRFQLVAAHWNNSPTQDAALGRASYGVDDIVAAATGVNPVGGGGEVVRPSPTQPPTPPPTAGPTPTSVSAPAPVDQGGSTPAAATTTTTPASRSIPPPTPLPPPLSAPAPVPTVTSPLSLTPPPPSTAAGLYSALQDRVLVLLDSLLRSNNTPTVPLKPPVPPRQFRGPDAELLRLQAEAMALAVEALNLTIAARPKPAPAAAPTGRTPAGAPAPSGTRPQP
jgi:hypothetical protein